MVKNRYILMLLALSAFLMINVTQASAKYVVKTVKLPVSVKRDILKRSWLATDSKSKRKIRPHRTKIVYKYPQKRTRKKVRFTPAASPNKKQVLKIMKIEQNRWGGPSLYNRINCESTFNSNATNGQYQGLLQIGPWWNSAWPSTPRKVVLKKGKRAIKPAYKTTYWSNGKKYRKLNGKVKVKASRYKVGHLPDNASPYHGWAAIRVGQRAVSGAGLSTAWSCGL